ncbi:nuclear transport factor 2 family protein [Streptomyces sp. NBC_00075]|uniref:nuclear transport factor 2 family protein n=1 Tax=Streptomyces sp. NBC_00075 TaxID=2975641 RepID=UPI003249872F
MSTTKDIVLTAATEMFGDKDVTAVDRWVAPGYIQHNATVADGPQGLRALIASLGEDFRYEPHRVITDGDTVALHGTYYGFGPKPIAAFDIFRVENGKLIEHWDALQPKADTTLSGRTETDGPTQVTDLDRTEANRTLVTDFIQQVFLAGQGEITDYVSTAQYDQHNPHIADGLDGLGAGLAAFAAQGKNMAYATLHKAIAEGNFVLTVSEGTLGTAPTAFYDLFRVADGKIVEHWDITPAIPDADKIPHDNGLF